MKVRQSLRHFKRITAIALCSLFLLNGLFCVPAFASSDRTEVVRVGRFPYEDQLAVDEEGHYSGYGFDYLQELARHTGWRYEFVDASWSDCLEMLAKGELDLMGAVMRSPTREEYFGFSESPMISGYGVLATALSNEQLPFEDFEAFEGIRVAAQTNNQQTANFIEYSRKNGFATTLLYYNSESEVIDAITTGEADAAILTNVLRSQTLRVVATFGENEAYFATTKGNTQLLDELNSAMHSIRLSDPYFNEKLDQRHYSLQTSTAISFTRAELDYIKNASVIPCTYVPDALPFSYYNPKTDSVDGIAPDICRLLEARTGLSFAWLNTNTATEATEMLQSGQALVMPAKHYDSDWAFRNGLSFTAPYMQGQMVLMSGENTTEPRTVALYDNLSQGKFIRAISADAQLIEYDAILDCVDAVSRGEADATLVNSTMASYLCNLPQYARMQTSPLYGYPADIAMAVSGAADPLLLSVLDKGLHSIAATEVNRITMSHMRTGKSGLLVSVLYHYPVETVLVISAIFLTLLIVLVLLLYIRYKNSKQLSGMLYTDSLTGHPNYSAMAKDAPGLLRKSEHLYALAYLDIHHFKVINDTFGYETGDKVLVATSDLLFAFVRPNERFARLYADTFVLLLCYDTEQALHARVNDLMGWLNRLPINNAENVNPLYLAGVYSLPAGVVDLDQACDRANYAKDSIQNSYVNTAAYYDDVMRSRVLVEKDLEGSMRSAMERKEFVAYYQPKVNAITGQVVGAEALVRWNRLGKGLLLPGEFLPFYEKNGFVATIDMLIFEQVCSDLRSCKEQGRQPVPVSVNFSRRHMQDTHLPQKLRDIADRYNVPTSLLEIELTETEELANLDSAMEFVMGLRSHGFDVSIDDYGTGYSSISFLQKLPLDSLKLDRTFMLNAMESGKARDIMRFLVSAMHHNKISVVCEGVETKQQCDFVVGLNCCIVQGFYFSRPLEREEFWHYLQEHGIDTMADSGL